METVPKHSGSALLFSLTVLWIEFNWAVLIWEQLKSDGAVSSESSTGLDIQNGSLMCLAGDADHQLETQLEALT